MAIGFEVTLNGISLQPSADGEVHVPQGVHQIVFELKPAAGSNVVFKHPYILWAGERPTLTEGSPSLGGSGHVLHLGVNNSNPGSEPQIFAFHFAFEPEVPVEDLIVTSEEPPQWDFTNPAIINEPPVIIFP